MSSLSVPKRAVRALSVLVLRRGAGPFLHSGAELEPLTQTSQGAEALGSFEPPFTLQRSALSAALLP